MKISNGFKVLLACLLLGGLLFFLKNKLSNQDTSSTEAANAEQIPANVGKRLYAWLSNSPSRPVIIAWNNVKGPSGCVFVIDENKQEKLFTLSKAGSASTGNWIIEGRKYEFHFYEDLEKKKPIAKLVLVKSGNHLDQTTVDLTESPTASQVTPAPSGTLNSSPTPNPTQGAPAKNNKHLKQK